MRHLVDPFRALQLWNCGQQTLEQIADRFAGVKAKDVRASLEYAVASNLGGLARPLPVPPPKVEKVPKPPRPPKPIKEPKPVKPPKPAKIKEPKPPRIPKPRPISAVKARREEKQRLAGWLVEMMENFFVAGNDAWSGKTFRPWINPAYVYTGLRRAKREDLIARCEEALKLWEKRVKSGHCGACRLREFLPGAEYCQECLDACSPARSAAACAATV